MDSSIAKAAGERAEALFQSREMYCAEAIMTAVCEALPGGLDPDSAGGLAAGFGEGLGGAGCVCGALAGAALAVSWHLRALPARAAREASRELHGRFTAENGSACCRVLTRPVKAIPAMRFAKCAGLTRFGAEEAVRIILERLPGLAGGAPLATARRSSLLSSLLSRLASLLRRLADKVA
jgi:C_GCAxxG_C_C family probable redox protein